MGEHVAVEDEDIMGGPVFSPGPGAVTHFADPGPGPGSRYPFAAIMGSLFWARAREPRSWDPGRRIWDPGIRIPGSGSRDPDPGSRLPGSGGLEVPIATSRDI